MLVTYKEFLERKSNVRGEFGFEPIWMPDFLFDFQELLVDWSIKKGRSAIFADCGLGKTPMQLVWAENIVRKTNRPVLILTPLAVSHQTKREADKFGIDAEVSRDGQFKSKIVITNYERLHYFDSAYFCGAVCDESSILKNFDGKRKGEITEFMRILPYRLLCTATAAPNDFDELGTSSEALGEMGYQDMLSMFFRQQTKKDHLGWGRTKYMLRSHAVEWFWKWVASWARAIRKPSDYGFEDGPFVLPELKITQHMIRTDKPRSGMLLSVPAITMQEQREERRLTIVERCELVAELVSDKDRSVSWCHLNDEGDMLESMIPDAVQVSGKDADDAKEEKLTAFSEGQIKTLITKPKIGAWGLNWQHCAHTTTFPSHSFEQSYQSIRRFLRFGQTRSVQVDIVTTPGEEAVLTNMKRKSKQADDMFVSLMDNMRHAMTIDSSHQFQEQERVPVWL